MNPFFFLILSFFLWSSCSTTAVSEKQQKKDMPLPFEGVITYQVITKSNIEGTSAKKIADLYSGTTSITYIKGAKTLSKTFNAAGTLLQEKLLLKDVGKNFFYSNNRQDSIYWYPCVDELDQVQLISIDRKENQQFLNYDCTTTVIKMKQLAEMPPYVIECVYYCAKEFPKNLTNNTCIDTIDQTLDAMIFAWEINGYPVCDRKFIPTHVERKPLEDSIFQLSKQGLPLQQF